MTTETPTPDDDEFSSAFSDLTAPASSTPTAAAAPSAERTAPVSPSADAPAPAEAPATAAAAPAEGTPPNASATSEPAPPAAGAEASTPTAAPPAATPSTEAAPAGYVSKEEFAALQAELAALKNASAAPAAEAKPEPPAPPAPLYSAEEQSAIDGYLKEWPDVAKGEALVRRAEYQQLANFMFSQFMPRIEQLERSTSTTVTRNQYKDIVSLVPDYDEVRDATLAWIETQPGFLKAAYQKVAQDGSPQDVAELITRFKKETNYAPAANPGAAGGAAAASAKPGGAVSAPDAAAPAAASGAAAAAAPAAGGGGGLAPAAAAAVAALKPVKTTRSEPVAAPDPNDFDAAFREYAAAS